jgi:hypothetical protein
VDGWGKQIFFPSTISFKRASVFLVKLIPAALLCIAAGLLAADWIWNLL